MPSKYRFVKSDIYYPNSNVPKNRLNIKDPQKLHQLESELLEEAYKIFIDELILQQSLMKHTSKHSIREPLNHSMIGQGNIEISIWLRVRVDFVMASM